MPIPREKLVLMMIPGMLFWALVGTGIATENRALIEIAVVLAVAVVITLLAVKLAGTGKRNAAMAKLWREGEPAQAVIKRISTRGGGVNDNLVIDLELEVTRAGGEPYPVQASQMISQLAIPRIQPGCQILVKVDPQSPTDLVVDEELTPYGYKG